MLQDEAVRTVPTGQEPFKKQTPIKVLTLGDHAVEQDIEVTLWRELSETTVEVGSYIEISHCLIGEWQQRPNLSSTRNTVVKVRYYSVSSSCMHAL